MLSLLVAVHVPGEVEVGDLRTAIGRAVLFERPGIGLLVPSAGSKNIKVELRQPFGDLAEYPGGKRGKFPSGERSLLRISISA
jgi:hypothetical protein